MSLNRWKMGPKIYLVVAALALITVFHRRRRRRCDADL